MPIPEADQVEKCPNCGSPLAVVADSPPVCRQCVMANIMDSNDHVDPDDYEIIREIGRGGSGTVYLATEKKIDRRVAVKLLSNLRILDEVTEQRFRIEAEATAALDHPNIIPVYSNGEMEGRPFFTMKYIGGGNLASRLAEFSEPAAAAKLVEKIARAVHHAHERGILHRDLKPSNILLDDAGEPFITDFGIAKRRDDQLNLTLTGAVMGTPNYMSPEQALGNTSQLTTATDTFSIGAILFELLNGRQAFDGETSHSVMHNVIETDVTFSQQVRGQRQRDLSSICLKCLEKNPSQRYVSASELAEDLARWQQDKPVHARHITSAERAWRWVRRRPYSVGAICLAVISLIAGTAISLFNADRADRERAVAEENAYFASVGSALSARERADFGEAIRHLENCPEEMRDRFEWRMVNSLSRADHVWRTDFPSAAPHRLTFNPQSSELMLLTRDRHIHFVASETGQVTRTATLPQQTGNIPRSVEKFLCAPDGNHFLFTSGQRLTIASLPFCERVHELPIPINAAVSWLTPDRLIYAHPPVADEKDTLPDESAWTFDLRTGTSTPLRPGKQWSGPIARSPDGKSIALVRMSKKVVIYPVDADFFGYPITRILSDTPFKELAFSGDNNCIGVHTGTGYSMLNIFDITSGAKVFQDYWPAPSPIKIVHGTYDIIATDQRSFYTRCRELGPVGRTRMNEVNTDHDRKTRKLADGPVAPLRRSFSRTLTGSRKTFTLAHAAPLVDLTAIPGEGILCTASKDGSLRRWASNIIAESPLRYDYHRNDKIAPSASPDGDMVLLLDRNRTPACWRRDSPEETPIPDGEQYLTAVDGHHILTRHPTTGKITCWERSITDANFTATWDIEATPGELGEPIATSLNNHAKTCACLFSDQILIIGISNRTSVAIELDPGNGQSISISPDGQTIASTRDHITRLYRPDGVRNLKRSTGNVSSETTCLFSRDGKLLYVGDDDGWVRTYDSQTLEELTTESWRAQSHPITALAISQRGDLIATAGGTAIALWSAEKETNQPRRFRIQINTGPGARSWMQFCADDTLLLHTAPDRPIEVLEAK